MKVDKDILRGAFLAMAGFLINLAGSLLFDASKHYDWASFLLVEIRPDYNYAELVFWGSGILKDILICFGVINALHGVKLFLSTRWGIVPVGMLVILYFRLEWNWQAIDLIYLMFTDPHVLHASKLKSLGFTAVLFIILFVAQILKPELFKKYRL